MFKKYDDELPVMLTAVAIASYPARAAASAARNTKNAIKRHPNVTVCCAGVVVGAGCVYKMNQTFGAPSYQNVANQTPK